MNNQKSSQKVLLVVILSVVIFFSLLYCLGKSLVGTYNQKLIDSKEAMANKQKIEHDYNLQQDKLEKERIELESIKQVFQTEVKSSAENLSVFGTMFDDIISNMQQNGLMIRSIEYQMNPPSDPVSVNFANAYNTCELKFFVVGSYDQLKLFLVDLNNNYPYLVSLSKLDVESFSGNTDYVLAHLSLNLYSKKANGDNQAPEPVPFNKTVQ